MDTTFKKIDDISRNYWVNLALSLIAQIAALLGILAFFHIEPSSSLFLIAAMACGALCFAFLIWNYYRLHTENKRLKLCAYELHQINHHYRDTLCEIFSRSSLELNDREMLTKEKEVLGNVCKKISNVFWNLTRKKCIVTAFLLEDDGGQKCCFPWAHSEFDINREQRPVSKFRITAENTRFTDALIQRAASTAHFFGENLVALEAEKKYFDATPQWEDLYTSCIVVPIRFYKNGNQSHHDDLGFLVVDTMSPKRLNGDEHVQFVAAFADQMYNFLNLMRGRYILKARSEKANQPH